MEEKESRTLRVEVVEELATLSESGTWKSN